MLAVLLNLTSVGAASDTSDYVDILVADVLPVHEASKQLQEAKMQLSDLRSQPDPVENLQAAKPIATDNWKRLSIGEFEYDETFNKRQSKSRVDEEKAYENALYNWKDALSAAEKESIKNAENIKIRQMIINEIASVNPKIVAIKPIKPIGKIKGFNFTGIVKLRRFDRVNMSFGTIKLEEKIFTTNYKGKDNILGRAITSPRSWEIKVNDLDVARKLKEDLAAEKVSFACYFEPRLVGYESPIIIKNESKTVVKDEAAQAKQVGGFIVLLGGLALGADAEALSGVVDDIRDIKTEKVEIKPAETREGVRFNFVLEEICVTLTDERGVPIAGVEMVPKFPQKTSVRVVSDPEGSKSLSCPLRTGDEFLTIAGKPVQTHQEFYSACAAQPNGKPYIVTYRAASDGLDHQFSATGGVKMGVYIQTCIQLN